LGARRQNVDAKTRRGRFVPLLARADGGFWWMGGASRWWGHRARFALSPRAGVRAREIRENYISRAGPDLEIERAGQPRARTRAREEGAVLLLVMA
jgi:hypothetical protein